MLADVLSVGNVADAMRVDMSGLGSHADKTPEEAKVHVESKSPQNHPCVTLPCCQRGVRSMRSSVHADICRR